MTQNEPASTTKTFLFTDLEGSTRLWQQYPQAMKTVLARHDEIIRSTVEESRGLVVKTTGDGFHAAFASVQDGLQASILAQQYLLAETWPETGPLHVRMGLHCGEAQQRGGDYYGTAVNRAARLMSAANGGQILISEAVANLLTGLLPNDVSLRDLGQHRLKDLQRRVHIYQIIHPDLPAEFPQIASLNLLPNNLPSQPTLFIGRQAELTQIIQLLQTADVRIVTLTGPGGTGKTRLSLQVCAEMVDIYDDGTYFVDLAPIRDPDSVLVTIARTIGLNESSSGSMMDDLQEQLRDKRMLLLLDNFEQVTGAAPHVAQLLHYCPHLKILTTSREALRVRGEHLYPVPPLGLPQDHLKHPSLSEIGRFEAVQLFVERAQSVKPNFELTAENAPAVVELCLRLDGLPLAIELAAARVRLFSPQALLQRLQNRLKMLRGGARDLPARQQTLRGTIDWSFDLLSASEQKLFAVLSIFSGCTFGAVEEVVADIAGLDHAELETSDALISLVDKSLLRLSEDEAGEPRLRMLETIREYAAGRLKGDSALYRSARRAHASYFAHFAQQQWGRMIGYERDRALEEMAADKENLHIAWRCWAEERDLEQLHKMVDALWLLYDRRGWYQATIDLTTTLLAVLSTTPSSAAHARQEILLQTSLARALLAVKGYTPEVEAAYARALTLSEEHDELPQQFSVLRALSSYYLYRAEFEKGMIVGRKILQLAEKRSDDFLRVHGYLVLGSSTGFDGSMGAGLEIINQGIDLFEQELQNPQTSLRTFQIGNNPGIACYTTSSFFLWWLGFPQQALERSQRAMQLAKSINHPFSLAYALFHTGALHMWRGEAEIARQRAQSMLQLSEELGFQLWQSLGVILQGASLAIMNRAEEGLKLVESGFASYQGHMSPPVFYPQIISMRAVTFAQAGQPAVALQLLEELQRDLGEERLQIELPAILMLKGDVMLALSSANKDEVLRLYQSILTNSLASENRILSLQVATRLCSLDLQIGNAPESGPVLEEIYQTFAEGFDTADLREAKSVLDQFRRQVPLSP